MKFQIKYPNASSTDRFEFQHSFVAKMPHLEQCRWCHSMTRWMDILFQVPVCSEECNVAMWEKYKADEKFSPTQNKFEDFFGHVKEELEIAERCDPAVSKDILIVVHDQLSYFKECVESIMAHTQNYVLHIWDNASRLDTQQYINGLLDADVSLTLHRSETNDGFIIPNNYMASACTGDYIILINSDCKVFPSWDRVMIGFLKEHPEVAQVGFWGGHLDAEGIGFGGANGGNIDYIPGWGFCISRATYEQYGLFDEEFVFAYSEDADLSLRLKESGHLIYSLYAPLVHHYQNKTIIEVANEGKIDVKFSFDHNLQLFRERWKDYLAHRRVLRPSEG